MSTSIGSTLGALAQEVRIGTIKVLQAAQTDWLRFAPPGTSNHILWHAGHALWLQDRLCVKLLAGAGELPVGWSESFGMDCRPVRQTANWPSRKQMVSLLDRQLGRLLELLQSHGDEELIKPANPTGGSDTVFERIIHGFYDEARHSGEMYLLLKIARARQMDQKASDT